MAKDAKRYRGGLACPAGSSLTQQQFKDECDINVMVKRFGGVPPPPVGVDLGRFADFSSAPDYFEAQQLLVRARAQFDALPAVVRRRFGNDPQQLLAFVSDKANLAEARELGLLKAEDPAPAPSPDVKGEAK